MSNRVQIVSLDSVVLSREKQNILQQEIKKYAEAVNFVIHVILRKHITSAAKTIEMIQDEFAKRFDTRPEYIMDVVKTARVMIGEHRKLAKVLRNIRNKRPRFKEGRIILSPPLIRVTEKALLLRTSTGNVLPIPFDKRSRNRVLDILAEMASGKRKHERVRLTWHKEGFVETDIRIPLEERT